MVSHTWWKTLMGTRFFWLNIMIYYGFLWVDYDSILNCIVQIIRDSIQDKIFLWRGILHKQFTFKCRFCIFNVRWLRFLLWLHKRTLSNLFVHDVDHSYLVCVSFSVPATKHHDIVPTVLEGKCNTFMTRESHLIFIL